VYVYNSESVFVSIINLNYSLIHNWDFVFGQCSLEIFDFTSRNLWIIQKSNLRRGGDVRPTSRTRATGGTGTPSNLLGGGSAGSLLSVASARLNGVGASSDALNNCSALLDDGSAGGSLSSSNMDENSNEISWTRGKRQSTKNAL